MCSTTSRGWNVELTPTNVACWFPSPQFQITTKYFPTQDTLAPWPSGWRNKKSVLHALHSHQWSQHIRLMKLAQTRPCSCIQLHCSTRPCLGQSTLSKSLHYYQTTLCVDWRNLRENFDLESIRDEYGVWQSAQVRELGCFRTPLKEALCQLKNIPLIFFRFVHLWQKTFIVSGIAWGSASQATLSFSRKYC